MKISIVFLSLLLIASCAKTQDKTYIASTPAAPVVRTFLEIPLTDSIDFIRWKLVLQNNRYMLECNYGIGKPNTNGFMNGGKKISLTGELKKEGNRYLLQNHTKILKIIELNTDLLHLLNADNSLLVGGGGWSYALNNTRPAGSDQVSIIAGPTVLKDSMTFHGRTPCNIPGLITPGSLCYKLKWYIILYGNAQKNEPDGYKILGTRWRNEGGKTGSWKIITGKNGRVIYQLNDNGENALLYLLKLDENILVFTDAQGKLLVGDEDFSYTINRK